MRFAENARRFCRHAGLGAALLSTLTNLVSPPVATANQNRSHQTRTPVKHVIVIIGENRTFDHVYATYKPRQSTVHLQLAFQRDRQSGRDTRLELLSFRTVQRAGQRPVFVGT